MLRFILTLTLFLAGACDLAAGVPKNVDATVNRYLAAGSDYEVGDLITSSQLEEIQVFLRRTSGNSLATHPQWRRRMLPDQAPLVRFFHSGGQAVLRDAAKKLGSFAPLDKLSRSGVGRKLIGQAIKQNSSAKLVRFVRNEQAKAKLMSDSPQRSGKKSTIKRIYTVDEFLEELKVKEPAPRQTASQASQEAADKQK